MKKLSNMCFALITLFILIGCSGGDSSTNNTQSNNPITEGQEVTIGYQIWMQKNLDVSNYRNGDPITQVSNPDSFASMTTGAWCYYNYDSVNGPLYGKLYNWYAVNDPRGLAPQGYHVPSDNEWSTLINFLGGDNVAAKKMKATTGWISPISGANNSSGFTALPGGFLYFDIFYGIGTEGSWWSSTADGPGFAWVRTLGSDSPDAARANSVMSNGNSVRCIRN
jgi:uncharacterized protein (TIGR02145 family)